MKQLPKELTPELLGLILDENIYEIRGIFLNEIIFWINSIDGGNIKAVNIDTLTRLMKEWCNNNKYAIKTEMHYKESINVSILKFYTNGKWNEPFNTMFNSEFEAVLKATHWVAKEKGLFNE